MSKTKIEWTQSDDGTPGKVWNPVRGCRLVSPGCTNCYAMRQAHRFSGPGGKYEGLTRLGARGPTWTGEARPAPEMLDAPLRWRKPCRIFVNSMSDLFHEDVPDDFIVRVFDVMRACTWAGGQNCGRIGGNGHTFQVLTKRAGRMADFCSRLRWTGEGLVLESGGRLPTLTSLNRDIWLGVSVEDQSTADERIPHLLRVPAAVRFVSAEPLLSSVDLSPWLGVSNEAEEHRRSSFQIHWIICGGESGPGARPFDFAWARSIRDRCKSAGVSCFIKQVGARPTGSWLDPDGPGAGTRHAPTCKDHWSLRDKKGGNWYEWPEDLRVRQFPEASRCD